MEKHTFEHAPEVKAFFDKHGMDAIVNAQHYLDNTMAFVARMKKITTDNFDVRDKYTAEFGWAVPNDAVLLGIQAIGKPLLSVGAGRGYWEFCMKRMGMDVIATDILPYVGYHPSTPNGWMEIIRKGAVASIPDDCHNLVLFMSWIPFKAKWGAMCAKKYLANGGNAIVWVGEGYEGATGDKSVWRVFGTAKDEQTIEIPQFAGLNDSVRIYRWDVGEHPPERIYAT